MKNNFSKRKILIIAIVTAVAVTLGVVGGVLGIYVFPKKLSPPTIKSYSVSDGENYKIILSWDDVKGKDKYFLEVKYQLRPEQVYKIETSSNTVEIDRLKGEMKVRIRVAGKIVNASSSFGEWQSFNLSGEKLSQPIFEVVQDINGFYTISQESLIMSEYIFNGKVKKINFYEWVAVPKNAPESVRNALFSQPKFVTVLSNGIIEKNKEPREILTPGEWEIFMRAINYKGDNLGDFGKLPGEPTELYELFEPSDWTCRTVSVN